MYNISNNIAFGRIRYIRDLPLQVVRDIKSTDVGHVIFNSDKYNLTMKNNPKEFITMWVYEIQGKDCITIMNRKFRILKDDIQAAYDGNVGILRHLSFKDFKIMRDEAVQKFYEKKK